MIKHIFQICATFSIYILKFPLTSLAPFLDLTISLTHYFLTGYYYSVSCHRLLSILYYTMVSYICVTTTLPLVSFSLYVIFSLFLEMHLHSHIIVIMTLPFVSPIDFSGHHLDINKFTYLLTYLVLFILKHTSTFH